MANNRMEEWRERLLAGDESFLDEVYLEHVDNCCRTLTKSSGAPEDRVRDAFMEALWTMRTWIQQGKMKETNIGGFLFTCARNYLRSDQRVRRVIEPFYYADGQETTKAVSAVMEDQAEYDPLVQQEDKEEAELIALQKKQALNRAISSLSEKCQKVLRAYIVDGVPLKDVQKQMGISSYDTIKATKYQCKKQLMKKFKIELEKERSGRR